MSIIKSSADHLTLEADGVGKDVKFNCNGVEKASISSAGAFTSTTIDATKLTGNLPAISGASLTGLSSADNTPSFQAYSTTSQNISTATWTKAQLNVEAWDTDSAYDSSTNHRFTVPAGEGGRYVLHGSLGFKEMDDGEIVIVRFKVNGTYTRMYDRIQEPNNGEFVTYSASTVVNMVAGDYVEMWVYHNEGATRPLEKDFTEFTGFKLAGV
jgi:hypothetical protein